MTKKLYEPGTEVVFCFLWFGRVNPHDGHHCRVIEGKEERRGKNNRIFRNYLLEDLDLPATSRAKRQFKISDDNVICRLEEVAR